MTIERKLLSTSPSGGAPDVAEVFSIDLFNGNNGTNAINNGIDLSGEGGLVWAKRRGGSGSHGFFDTERGANKILYPNSDDGQLTGTDISSFNSNGFTMGVANQSNFNNPNVDSVAWTFRKKEKFFDVVTYTGNSSGSPQTIAHNLGSVPAMIIVKCTSLAKDWIVYHKNLASSSPEDKYLLLNSTREIRDYTYWYDTAPTDSAFTVGDDSEVNGHNATYVAYLFADNSAEDAEEQMVKCGSYTGNGNASGPVINLGWEPQFVLYKANANDDWIMWDTMRGMYADGNGHNLVPNSTAAESSLVNRIRPLATGFQPTTADSNVNGNNVTYIYMAIRAPMMKKPSAATDVFAVDAAGSGAIPAWESGFPVDFAIYRFSGNADNAVGTRMLGTGELFANNTATIAASGAVEWDYSNGFYTNNSRSASYYSWMWKRAKGYFDVVAYTGTGSPRTLAHSLGVVPEMIVCKSRSTTGGWQTYHKTTGNTKYLYWNQNYPAQTSSSVWNNTTPTDSVFTVGNGGELNGNNIRYVAYLFATLAGISKVGSYTGTGSDINVDCGFSAGARFILIKRTDATGEDWIYYDTVRGIVAGVDPFLKLNETNQQNAGNDGVDPLSSGFTVTSSSSNNTSGGTYIFYAIA